MICFGKFRTNWVTSNVHATLKSSSSAQCTPFLIQLSETQGNLSLTLMLSMQTECWIQLFQKKDLVYILYTKHLGLGLVTSDMGAGSTGSEILDPASCIVLLSYILEKIYTFLINFICDINSVMILKRYLRCQNNESNWLRISSVIMSLSLDSLLFQKVCLTLKHSN